MNTPSRLKRSIAFPPVAVAIFLLCTVLLWNWDQGNAPWPVGIFAIVLLSQTCTAIREVGRYKTWSKAWNSMGDQKESNARSGKRKVLIPIGIVFGLTLIAQIPAIQDNAGPIMAVSFVAGFVVLIIGLVQKLRRRALKKASTAPVGWLVGRPGASPFRSELTQTLPDYSARIISRP